MFITVRIEKKAISKLLPILTDVDGVLLEWEPAFTKWMNSKGYEVKKEGVYKQSTRFGIEQALSDSLTNRFNESAWMGYLKPIPGAVKWLERFEDEGYTFECLTSQSEDIYAGYLRKYNLEMLFGKVITECTCIATGSDKDEHLKNWAPGHWWIEDKPQNAIAGLEAGHKPILITQPYNKDFEHEGIERADTWEDIFNIILTKTG
jgi:beta-phosphoglucomutase-like phosphatase (HAD superfamily)